MPLKICNVCLQSNFLCSACNKKMEHKEMTKTDVAVSRALYNLSKDVKNFNADFLRAIETEKFIVILVDRAHAGKIIGTGGKNVKTLGEILKKNVKIIERAGEKQMLEKLLNVPILALNKVYSGQEKIRIRIEKRYRNKVNLNLKPAIEKLLEKPVEIVFE